MCGPDQAMVLVVIVEDKLGYQAKLFRTAAPLVQGTYNFVYMNS